MKMRDMVLQLERKSISKDTGQAFAVAIPFVRYFERGFNVIHLPVHSSRLACCSILLQSYARGDYRVLGVHCMILASLTSMVSYNCNIH
jgi:hypothetical protein